VQRRLPAWRRNAPPTSRNGEEDGARASGTVQVSRTAFAGACSPSRYRPQTNHLEIPCITFAELPTRSIEGQPYCTAVSTANPDARLIMRSARLLCSTLHAEGDNPSAGSYPFESAASARAFDCSSACSASSLPDAPRPPQLNGSATHTISTKRAGALAVAPVPRQVRACTCAQSFSAAASSSRCASCSASAAPANQPSAA
jgi:hypothetical protein